MEQNRTEQKNKCRQEQSDRWYHCKIKPPVKISLSSSSPSPSPISRSSSLLVPPTPRAANNDYVQFYAIPFIIKFVQQNQILKADHYEACVRAYACIYIHIHVRAYVCVYVCMYVCICVLPVASQKMRGRKETEDSGFSLIIFHQSFYGQYVENMT